MTLTAPVVWAQRKASIFLTIELPDVKEETAKIDLTDKKLTFSGTSEDKEYQVELEFLNEIDSKAEDTKFKIKPRGVSFFLVKKEEGSWNRLLENKQLQKTNVKVDFNKWVDSDEEDGTTDFNLDGMQGMGGMPGMGGGMPGMGGMGGMPGMGGMGGMPGMGGMGGMPGMGGMEQMMGGMGGMPGMGGMGGMDMQAMMEQMKNLKGGLGETADGDEDEADSDDDDLPDLEDDNGEAVN